MHVDPNAKERAGWGYAGPIAISALAHVAFIYLVLFALPHWFTAENTPPPAYSVNIVDNIPAGDLGTHTCRGLSGGNPPEPEPAEPPEAEAEQGTEPSKVEPPAASTAIEAKNDDPNAFALNKPTATEEPTPAPTATSTPTPEPTATTEDPGSRSSPRRYPHPSQPHDRHPGRAQAYT